MNYVKADNDARCITIVRETAGSYIVRLDHVLISGAVILKEGKEWSLYLPIMDEPMTFRTLTDARAHMLSWFKVSYIPDMNAAHAEAIEHNDCIDEAYAGKAEDVNMTVPAYRACLAKHTADGDIFLSGLWNAPISLMTKVVVFDEGARYGVTAGNAAYYTGEVQDMPRGEVSTCVHCNSVLLTPEKGPSMDDLHTEAMLMDAERTNLLRDENEAYNLNECMTIAAQIECDITVHEGQFPYVLTRNGVEVASLLSLSHVRNFLGMTPWGYVAYANSDAIDSIIHVAEQAIAALTPILETAKALFENARDNGGSEELVGIAYQAYCDIYRSIEEYRRTIMFARDI